MTSRSSTTANDSIPVSDSLSGIDWMSPLIDATSVSTAIAHRPSRSVLRSVSHRRIIRPRELPLRGTHDELVVVPQPVWPARSWNADTMKHWRLAELYATLVQLCHEQRWCSRPLEFPCAPLDDPRDESLRDANALNVSFNSPLYPLIASVLKVDAIRSCILVRRRTEDEIDRVVRKRLQEFETVSRVDSVAINCVCVHYRRYSLEIMP